MYVQRKHNYLLFPCSLEKSSEFQYWQKLKIDPQKNVHFTRGCKRALATDTEESCSEFLQAGWKAALTWITQEAFEAYRCPPFWKVFLGKQTSSSQLTLGREDCSPDLLCTLFPSSISGHSSMKVNSSFLLRAFLYQMQVIIQSASSLLPFFLISTSWTC